MFKVLNFLQASGTNFLLFHEGVYIAEKYALAFSYFTQDERCLHLLKKFSLVDFEQKPIKHVEGKELKFGRCQIANQLVELPIVHQIYDAIDAAGVEGMLIKEVFPRVLHLLFCTSQ